MLNDVAPQDSSTLNLVGDLLSTLLQLTEQIFDLRGSGNFDGYCNLPYRHTIWLHYFLFHILLYGKLRFIVCDIVDWWSSSSSPYRHRTYLKYARVVVKILTCQWSWARKVGLGCAVRGIVTHGGSPCIGDYLCFIKLHYS